MIFRPTDDDLRQLSSLGLTPEQVQQQIDHFHDGFPKANLTEAATPQNGGIRVLSDAEISRLERIYRQQQAHKKIIKFVPASGAASRMFKELYSFSSTYFGVANNFGHEFPEVKDFLEHLRTFAFYPDLRSKMEESGLDIDDYMQRGDYTTVINYLLKGQYLGYGELPKALLKFHRYGAVQRTPLEEHIVEGALYAQCLERQVNLHFTISPEHRQAFRRKVAEVRHYYESTFNVRLNISSSEQRHYTDIIAVDEQNQPVRDDDGRLVFRPGGHGALIENLAEQRADLIFIKNIDNVVPDWMKHTTVIYKKVIGGLLLDLQGRCFDALRQLDAGADRKALGKIADLLHDELGVTLPDTYDDTTLRALLDRPIRVCGMVKNTGEPGGGPFRVRDTQGHESLQIVETAQINRRDPSQEAILQSSTHFNPVDLVCGTKNYRGRYFDLRRFVDPMTGFISKKSKGATVVKSQELPGLWNGAMAHWNTVFVEVPIATFNPVKTINDLLRKEHLES